MNLDDVVLCLMPATTFSTGVVKLRHEIHLNSIPVAWLSSSHHGVKSPIGSKSATDVGQRMRQIEYHTMTVLSWSIPFSRWLMTNIRDCTLTSTIESVSVDSWEPKRSWCLGQLCLVSIFDWYAACHHLCTSRKHEQHTYQHIGHLLQTSDLFLYWNNSLRRCWQTVDTCSDLRFILDVRSHYLIVGEFRFLSPSDHNCSPPNLRFGTINVCDIAPMELWRIDMHHWSPLETDDRYRRSSACFTSLYEMHTPFQEVSVFWQAVDRVCVSEMRRCNDETWANPMLSISSETLDFISLSWMSNFSRVSASEKHIYLNTIRLLGWFFLDGSAQNISSHSFQILWTIQKACQISVIHHPRNINNDSLRWLFASGMERSGKSSKERSVSWNRGLLNAMHRMGKIMAIMRIRRYDVTPWQMWWQQLGYW